MFPLLFPSSIVAGDTIAWESQFTDYEPLTHTLTWAIRGLSSLNLTGVAQGDRYLTTITALQSQALSPGRYDYQAYATDNGGNRTTVASGSFQVLPNLSQINATYDGRSQAEEMLDLVNKAISALVTDNVASYRIKEREVTKQNLPDLIVWRDKLRIEVAREKAAQLGSSRKLYTRFDNG